MDNIVSKNELMMCKKCTWLGYQKEADTEPDGALICPNCSQPLEPAT